MFLHGYLSSKESFYRQIEYFSRFYRVTAVDFIGFGKSAPLTEPFSAQENRTLREAQEPPLRGERIAQKSPSRGREGLGF